MSLTQEQIAHIARKLAKLSPTDEQIARYVNDLNPIVDYIDILNRIPESELQNIRLHDGSHLIPRLDEEKVVQDPTREELLACSPKKIIGHQIAVDNIME